MTTKGQADLMVDVSKAALPALWKADPGFEALAKYLYGQDATPEDVIKDIWGDTDEERTRRKRKAATGIGALGATGAAAATVHSGAKLARGVKHGFPKGEGWKGHAVVGGVEGASLVGDVFLTHTMHEAAKEPAQPTNAAPLPKPKIIKPKKPKTYEVKAASAPDQSDVHVPGAKGKQKPPLPTEDEKARKIVGKSFIELVSKAHDAGLIDDEGNLNWTEIEKSRQYFRDNGGKFASSGKHTARNVSELALAGGLAAGGAALAAKSPNKVKYASEATRFAIHHLKSPDKTERHAARALLPHVMGAHARALGTAGVGTVSSAGAVYEGTQAYQHMREDAASAARRRKAAAPLEEKAASLVPLRASAEVLEHGMNAAEHIEGHIPKHAKALGRIKRLRHAAAEGARKAVMNPTGAGLALVDMVKHEDGVEKAERQYHRDQSGKFAAGAAGLAAVAGASEGAGQAVNRQRQGAASFERDQASMYQHLAHGSTEYAQESGSRTMHQQVADLHSDAALHGNSARKLAHEGDRALHLGRKGALIAGAGAAAAGYGALIAHADHKQKEAKAKRAAARAQRLETKAARDTTWEGEFSKVDEDKRQVFGWASVTEMDGKPVVDLQGDYIHPDEIEKAAYEYVVNARVGGDMHSRVDEYGNVVKNAPLHVSDLIESMVFTPEKCEAMGISKSLAGRWWTGFQINDPDIWDKVKTGERTGFSIHGLGIRKSVEPEEIGLEDELIEKAWDESDSPAALIDNLVTLAEVTGVEKFLDVAENVEKHVFGHHIPEGVEGHQTRTSGRDFSDHLGPNQRKTSHQRSEHKAYKEGKLLYGHPLGDYNKQADRVNDAIDQANSGKPLEEHHFAAGHEAGGVWATHKNSGEFGLYDPATVGSNTKGYKVHSSYRDYKRDHAGKFAKHLDHGMHAPQISGQQSRNAGVYGPLGSAAGGLAGGLIGAKSGHVGEGAAIGGVIGGSAGTAAGVVTGKGKRPERPPAVHQAMMTPKAARAPEADDFFEKSFAGGVERVARVVEPAVMGTGRALDRMGVGAKVQGAAQHQADKAIETTGVRRRVRRAAAGGLSAAAHTHPVVGLTAAGAATTAGGAAVVHQARKRAPEAEDYFGKAVDNTNRLGGQPSARQGAYTQWALQQATEQLAPQVANHLQMLQEQQWQQQMMEQAQMQQMANQSGQDFAVQMGPYANQPSQRPQNPLAPPQTPQQGGSQNQGPQTPTTPTAPTAQNFFGS